MKKYTLKVKKVNLSRVLIKLLFILCPYFLTAQFKEQIRSIRPGATVGVYTIGKRIIQFQSGLQFRNREGLGLDQNTIFFRNAIRFGFAERAEINAVINWQKTDIDDPNIPTDATKSITGISTLRLGGRINLINQSAGLFRGLGINGRLWLKAPTENFRTQNVGGRIVASTAYALPAKIAMNLSTGIVWRGNNQNLSSLYGIRLRRGITANLGIVVESFGLTDHWEPDYGTGLYYIISDNFKIDVYHGFLGNSNQKEHFLELGISWRFRVKSSKN